MRKRRAPRKPESHKPRLSDGWTERLIVAGLLIVASVLLLANLGNIYLWQDEAQTALIAKTILTHGVPVGYNGTNHFSQDFGAECGKNYLWLWHPWFPFYLIAGFFAAFGVSSFTARLPFALMGIGTVILTYYFGRALWGSRRIAVLAAVLLLLCVPFLILARQCRYYSPAMLFSVAGLCSYVLMLRGRKGAPTAFVLSAVLLFQTHYVFCAGLIATALLHARLFHRDRTRILLAASGVVLAAGIPWMILFSRMGYVSQHYAGPLSRLGFSGYYVAQIAKHMFPPALLVVLGGVCLFNRRRTNGVPSPSDPVHGTALLGAFSAITVFAVVVTGTAPFFRYLCAVIPAFMLLMALGIDYVMRLSRGLGIIVLIVLAYWWRMPDMLYEITHDYDGPVEAIVTYLNAHGREGDIVAAPHEDMPIKFYTKMRVIGGMTGEDLSPVRNARFVIARHEHIARETEATAYMNTHIPLARYKRVVLDCSDNLYENREDPEKHLFRTPVNDKRVTIYVRPD